MSAKPDQSQIKFYFPLGERRKQDTQMRKEPVRCKGGYKYYFFYFKYIISLV